jgi:hypothetical protein
VVTHYDPLPYVQTARGLAPCEIAARQRELVLAYRGAMSIGDEHAATLFLVRLAEFIGAVPPTPQN